MYKKKQLSRTISLQPPTMHAVLFKYLQNVLINKHTSLESDVIFDNQIFQNG